MTQPFVGQITVYPYTFPPVGWADCAGQLLPIQQNTALFSLLGTNFGGDGVRTFGLPDLRGRVAVNQGPGPGLSGYSLGQMTGAETVQLTTPQSGNHGHSLNATSAHGTVNPPAGSVLATPAAGNPRAPELGYIYNPGSPNTQLQLNAVAPAGGGAPHNNVQPYLTLRYCISLRGVFPSRP